MYRPRQFAAACILVGAVAGGSAAPVVAQQQVARAPQIAPVDVTTASKMVWATMVALDQANVTGNYSVLRDLGAPGFQANNSAATLAGTFASLRAQQVDLSTCLIVAPTFQFAPAIVEGGLLRLRGSFPLRPTSVAFDMLFMNDGGQWRLFGLAVTPVISRPPIAPTPTQNTSTRR